MSFNERLKMYRNHCSLTQKAVASAIGVSLRGYQQYEQGKFEPNIEKLIKLADLFGISVDELIGHNLPQNSLVDSE
ncbi:MAG: helix-turn-helix transcriptional regulator [Eubacteriales bacterium]|nr:helix-turn-helix transcriptional regulator [Eubacteriales bacterium]